MTHEHEQEKDSGKQGKVSPEGEALAEDNRDLRKAANEDQAQIENEGLGGHGGDAGDPSAHDERR